MLSGNETVVGTNAAVFDTYNKNWFSSIPMSLLFLIDTFHKRDNKIKNLTSTFEFSGKKEESENTRHSNLNIVKLEIPLVLAKIFTYLKNNKKNLNSNAIHGFFLGN
jgi:hypothetical protein